MTNNPQSLPVDELGHYLLFALVTRHQSFSRAAALAGVARSVASARVQRLEATLGTQLLRRTTRRVTPTEEGLRLYAACVPLLEDALRLGRAAGLDRTRGLVRINAPQNLVSAGLGALLSSVLEERPELSLELSVDNRAVDLQQTAADVVVRIGRRLPPDVVARRLGRTRLLVVAAPAYLARRGTPTSPEQLLAHECLRYSPSPAVDEWRFDSKRGAYPVAVRSRFETDDSDTLRRMALDGRGVAMLPELMAADDIAAGTLVRLLAGARRDTLECWAILPAGRLASLAARGLVELLARRLPAALPRLGR